jgi:hypothetical protein
MKPFFMILMRVFIVGVCIILCQTPAVIHVQNASEALNLGSMSYEEKLKLWNSFSEEKKEAIRKKARGMSDKKFSQLKNNFQKIEKFAPEEQKRVRNNFQRMRKFAPKQRKRVRENFKRFQKLPNERKQFYRQRFRGSPFHEMNTQGNQGNFNRNENPPDIRKDFPQNARPESRPGRFQPGAESNEHGTYRRQPQGKFPVRFKNGKGRGIRMQEIRGFREKMMKVPHEPDKPKPENAEKWNRVKDFRLRFNMPQEKENRTIHFPETKNEHGDRPSRQKIEQKNRSEKPSNEGRIRPGQPGRPKKRQSNPAHKNRPTGPFKKN